MIATFGVLAALAGVEHGVGELWRGPVPPPGLVIQSWPDVPAFEVLGGSSALTVLPNLVRGPHHRRGGRVRGGVGDPGPPSARGMVLLLLSVLLLVVGGGFGPPLIGIVLGIVALEDPAARALPAAPPRSAGPVVAVAAGPGGCWLSGAVAGHHRAVPLLGVEDPAWWLG